MLHKWNKDLLRQESVSKHINGDSQTQLNPQNLKNIYMISTAKNKQNISKLSPTKHLAMFVTTDVAPYDQYNVIRILDKN